MRFLVQHRTNAHWESGARPGPDLIARVGDLLGALGASGVLRAAEGLRPSAEGARLTCAGGHGTVTPGPFPEADTLPSGFVILRAASLGDAVERASSLAAALGDVVIDVRPVTEPWDIGLAPEPEGPPPRRWMALYRTADDAWTDARRAALDHALAGLAADGVLVTSERLLPSSRGARLRATGSRRTVIDGPFAESKELIAGYVLVEVPTLPDATRLALRYLDAVDAAEVDVRAVE